MSASPPIRFAIASPARWGNLLLDAAAEAPDRLRFAGVWRRDAARMQETVARHGGRAYASYEEMIADPNVDAVVLPTPHHLHFPQTLAALRACRNVVVENPIAKSLADD